MVGECRSESSGTEIYTTLITIFFHTLGDCGALVMMGCCSDHQPPFHTGT